MSRIIPPRRDELIASAGEVTQRYIEFFESLADITTSTSIVVEDAVDIPAVLGAARFATRNDVEEIRSQLAFIRPFILSQVQEKTRWLGKWTPNHMYQKGDQVSHCGWLAIARQNTFDQACPQPYGTPITEFNNDPAAAFTTETALSVNAVALGVRYQGDVYHGILNEIRFFTVTASTDYFYDFYLVDADANYCPIASQVQFAATGWHRIELSQRLVINQSEWDLICIVTNHDAGSSTFNGPWNYADGDGAPVSGQILHQNNGWEVRIHYTDNNSTDQTANLQTLVTGDTIDITGQQWRVVDVISTAGTYITLHVTPALRAGAGLYTATFTHYTATDIDYPRILNQYLANANVDGFFDTDSDGYPPSTDDNSYGLDVLFQPAQTSADWDVQAFE